MMPWLSWFSAETSSNFVFSQGKRPFTLLAMLTLLHGMLLGFAIAAPVGPIGVLCIQRTLAFGWRAGMIAGLGTATADALYGLLAVSGAALVTNVLVANESLIRVFGGLLLLPFAVMTLRARPSIGAASVSARGFASLYASTFFLTLANPMTIVSFVALVASAGLAGNAASGGVLVLGFFVGSAAWWALLSGATALLRARVAPERLRGVNVASSVVLFGFALYALTSGLLAGRV